MARVQYLNNNIFLQVYKNIIGIPFLSDSRNFNCQSFPPIYVIGIKKKKKKGERIKKD